MIFEENKKNLTYYATPFGNLQMGIAATKIAVKEEEQGLNLAIDYALEINAEHAADCQIQINVKPKVPGNLPWMWCELTIYIADNWKPQKHH